MADAHSSEPISELRLKETGFSVSENDLVYFQREGWIGKEYHCEPVDYLPWEKTANCPDGTEVVFDVKRIGDEWHLSWRAYVRLYGWTNDQMWPRPVRSMDLLYRIIDLLTDVSDSQSG